MNIGLPVILGFIWWKTLIFFLYNQWNKVNISDNLWRYFQNQKCAPLSGNTEKQTQSSIITYKEHQCAADAWASIAVHTLDKKTAEQLAPFQCAAHLLFNATRPVRIPPYPSSKKMEIWVFICLFFFKDKAKTFLNEIFT